MYLIALDANNVPSNIYAEGISPDIPTTNTYILSEPDFLLISQAEGFGKYVYDIPTSSLTINQAYVIDQNKNAIIAQLLSTDDAIIRGIDDLVEILLSKGILVASDIPTALAANLQSRVALRTELNQL